MGVFFNPTSQENAATKSLIAAYKDQIQKQKQQILKDRLKRQESSKQLLSDLRSAHRLEAVYTAARAKQTLQFASQSVPNKLDSHFPNNTAGISNAAKTQ